MKDLTKDKLTVTQASKLFGEKTVQALYQAIKKGRLKAFYEEKKWWITKQDLIIYHETKHSRIEARYAGAPLYDMEAGEISVSQAAKMCGLKPQHLYNQLRRGAIRGIKRGEFWVLTREQVADFYSRKLEERENPKQLRFA
jgi:hypothetical protein